MPALIHYTSVVTQSLKGKAFGRRGGEQRLQYHNPIRHTAMQPAGRPASNWVAGPKRPRQRVGWFRKRRQAGHIITECAATKWRCRRRKIISCSITCRARKRRDAKMRAPFPGRRRIFTSPRSLSPGSARRQPWRACVLNLIGVEK